MNRVIEILGGKDNKLFKIFSRPNILKANKHKLYFDVPYGYEYKWGDPNDDGEKALSRELGVKVKFICNAHGASFHLDKVGAVGNTGDAHVVELDSEKDELFFLVKTGFTKLNSSVVEDYLKNKRRQ